MTDEEDTPTEPLCPNCETELPRNGDCYQCDFETENNYLTDDRASIHDSDWENTVEVTSTIKMYEHSEIHAYSDARSSFPFVGYRANYPGGVHHGKIPMFPKGLPFDLGNLSKVLRVEGNRPSPTDHPRIVAVYSRADQDMMLELNITNDKSEIKPYSGRSDLLGRVTDVLWDADHPQTTDPLHDIELQDVDN